MKMLHNDKWRMRWTIFNRPWHSLEVLKTLYEHRNIHNHRVHPMWKYLDSYQISLPWLFLFSVILLIFIKLNPQCTGSCWVRPKPAVKAIYIPIWKLELLKSFWSSAKGDWTKKSVGSCCIIQESIVCVAPHVNWLAGVWVRECSRLEKCTERQWMSKYLNGKLEENGTAAKFLCRFLLATHFGG